MHAAVVKFNALPDAVRAAAEHHDFFVAGGTRFAFAVFGFIAGIEVGGAGGKFRRAGVDPLVDGAHFEGVAVRAHGVFIGVQQLGQTAVGKAFLFEFAHLRGINAGERLFAKFFGVFVQRQFGAHDVFNLHEEPRVDAGNLVHFLQGPASGEGVAHVPDAFGAGFTQFFFQQFAVLGFFVHAVDAHFQPAQGFLERFLEGAANGHDFAHGFHLRGQAVRRLREFFKGETRNFGDHVVNRRFKAGRRGAAGDVVAQLIQRVAHRQLGGNLGNRKAGGFGSQRRRARHARVHFNDHHAAIGRVDGKLHVGAARVDANFTQHGNRGVAQQLVFLVGERLRRSDGDGIAGVHAHRVEVFNRADDDAVVRLVAYHFHLKLFPAQQRFFNQQLVRGRGFQTALADGDKFFHVVGDAAAGAAQCETGTDDDRKTDARLHLQGFFQPVRNA